MKNWIIILIVAITACNSEANNNPQDKDPASEHKNAPTAVPLNKGSKWKADQATKKNVAAMAQVVNNNRYADPTTRGQLYASLQTKVDTLVGECRMQGAEHDALHVWLEKVMKDMKELKEEDNNYSQVYAELKRDIESFNAFFE